MKKFILLLLLSTLIITLSACNNQNINNTRTIDATVTEITETGILLTDIDGEMWEVDDVNINIGNKVTIMFDTMGTQSIYDDKIEDINLKDK